MNFPLLSIAIPTRNRAAYLRESLGALAEQVRDLGDRAPSVALHVSDNTSTDNTAEVVHACQQVLPAITYHRHPENLGASRNVNSCVRQARGTFCWVVGDDEQIQPGAIAHLCDLLATAHPPALTVCFDTGYDPRLPRPQTFPSYRDYALECARRNPHALIEHTLVSSNVFRTSAFDLDTAERTLATDYSHMYAILTGLREQGGPVQVTDLPIITVRRRRAPAVDGVWPTNLEASWTEYLLWQQQLFDLPALSPEAALEHVRRQLLRKLTRHPFRYFRDNLQALRDPRALWWFLKRLLFHSRKR